MVTRSHKGQGHYFSQRKQDSMPECQEKVLCFLSTVQNLESQGTVASKQAGKTVADKLSTVQQLLLVPTEPEWAAGAIG